MGCCERNANCLKIGYVIGLVSLICVSILVGISFSYVEYYQIAFRRQRSTGSVDTQTIYSTGRYLFGPDFEFKTFPSDAHFLDLKDVAVFLSDKLEVNVNVHMQYFLRKDELKTLHDAFDLYYEDVVKSRAIDAMKGVAPQFSTREMIRKRRELEDAFFKAVRERLGGECCRPDCDSYTYACPPGCIEVSKCTEANKGMNIDVRYFQLSYIDIPGQVEEEYLTALTLLEDALREELIQNAKVIRKNTTAMVADIKNDARETTEKARATANLISAISNANYTSTLESARVDGLKEAFSVLGLSDQEQQNSVDYLRSLKGNGNVHLTVDFQQRIVGKL